MTHIRRRLAALLATLGILGAFALIAPTPAAASHCQASGRSGAPRLTSTGNKHPVTVKGSVTEIKIYAGQSRYFCPQWVYVNAFDNVRVKCPSSGGLTFYETGWHRLYSTSSHNSGICSGGGGTGHIDFERLD